MLSKETILENVGQYSVDELVAHIRNGIVTFDELCNDTDGEFSAAVRREVEQKLKGGDAEEWAKVQKENTIEAANRYLREFPNGQFRPNVRALKAQLEQAQQENELAKAESNAWNTVDKKSLGALKAFVKEYPNSEFVKEAKKLINELTIGGIMGFDSDALVKNIYQFQTDRKLTIEQKDNNIIKVITNFIGDGKISKQDFLDKIDEDHNLLSAGIVKRLIEQGTISAEDLLYINIDKKFIQKMYEGEEPQRFSTPERLDRIHKQSTEIYFWGIPSSGKSCALGAILSVAASGTVAHSMAPDTDSQGYGYMTKLINLFQNGEVGALMEGTAVDSFYEMGFDLVDNDDKTHPITCIDMAGELMRCMYKENAGDAMTEKERVMLDTMNRVLIDNRSVNRKMHIFVIEYGAEDRKYEGLPQKTYLDGAVSYIKNTGIFKKDTDAVYIMITKADKVKNADKETFNKYIEDKYRGFYNGLEQICKDNEINRGKVEKIAFSLGDVCFQNYCKFDARPASNVVRLILNRSACTRGGKRGFFEKLFRG